MAQNFFLVFCAVFMWLATIWLYVLMVWWRLPKHALVSLMLIASSSTFLGWILQRVLT